jgi:hypothetical protein
MLVLVLAPACFVNAVEWKQGAIPASVSGQNESTCAAPATVSDRNASCKSIHARFYKRCPLQERDHATILPVIRHDDVDTRIDNLFARND